MATKPMTRAQSGSGHSNASGFGANPDAYAGTGFQDRFGATERNDNWWAAPLIQAIGLTVLGIYATWAAFQGEHFQVGGYLSPFYSPTLKPSWWPISPALLILWAPLGFRATCYYYRKAYYRAFFADPPACAVGEIRHGGYCGESKFPFILQNLHRYFLYLALVILIILWVDVVHAFMFDHRFGIGLGSFAILFSTGMLSLYTLSCHSLRHLVGGKLDRFSCVRAGILEKPGVRKGLWDRVSFLNTRHMAWAWWSLFAVCSADLYVRMLSMGFITDLRIF